MFNKLSRIIILFLYNKKVIITIYITDTYFYLHNVRHYLKLIGLDWEFQNHPTLQ